MVVAVVPLEAREDETGKIQPLPEEARIGGKPAQSGVVPVPSRTVWFDVTDLLFFFRANRHVSGIQRVQCGYIVNILAGAGLGGARHHRFCVRPQFHALARGYGELPANLISRVIDLCSSRAVNDPLASADDAVWSRHIDRVCEAAAALPVRMNSGDVLCILGAPWIVPDYALLIGQMKRELGILCIQLIHDVVPTLIPEVCFDGVIDVFNRALAGTLLYADAVLTLSQYTADSYREVAARLGLPSPRIATVAVGGSVSYDEPDKARAQDQVIGPTVARIAAKPFVLCVGTIEPRKNHAYLFNIWRRLAADLGARTPDLVCVGRQGWHMDNFIRQLEVTDYLGGTFKVLSDISDAELDHLYCSCLFTVFPSLFEGWGLPITESLAAGRTCVTSNTSSMPEVGGEFATYVDPHDVGDGYDVIRGLIDDPARVRAIEDRIRNGYKVTSWSQATRDLLREMDDAAAAASLRTPASATILLGRPYAFAAARAVVDPYARIREETRVLTAYALLASRHWHEPESWGVWSSGRIAKLAMSVAHSVGNLVAYIGLCLPPHVGAQTVTIRMNGTMVTRERIGTEVRTYRVSLSQAVIASARHDGALDITIALDESVNLSCGGQGDQRVLGIGLATFMVCTPDDSHARIEAAERHCFEAQVAGAL